MKTRERADLSSVELARAVRLLAVRSRREATGLFAGNYVSAFRGSGREFEDSRPYAPGDDIRSIDWNATARHQMPYVKRFREERDQTLLFALDVSASMRFGSAGRSKAMTAAHAVALMAAAAARAGDRCGLVAFDSRVRAEVPADRGVAHTWRLIRTAVEAAAGCAGETRIGAGLRALHTGTRRRSVVIVLSDFRDAPPGDTDFAALRGALAGLGQRHDLVAAVVLDAREEALPAVGPVRLEDPERPNATLWLDTGSRRARARYAAACAERRRALALALRRGGASPLWLRTDRSPLHALGRFFHERAARRSRAAA